MSSYYMLYIENNTFICNLFKSFGLKSHSKNWSLKIESVLKKRVKIFALANKGRFSLFWSKMSLFWSEISSLHPFQRNEISLPFLEWDFILCNDIHSKRVKSYSKTMKSNSYKLRINLFIVCTTIELYRIISR